MACSGAFSGRSLCILFLLYLPVSPASEVGLEIEYELALDNESEILKSELVLTPSVTSALSADTSVAFSARLRLDKEDRIAPGNPEYPTRSEFNRVWNMGNHGDFEILELYLDHIVGDTFLRVGKQQVVWGQADGVRVLDVVNPVDYREFVLPELEDRRIPLWMFNAEIPIASNTLQMLVIPDTSYDMTPVGRAQFAPSSPLLVPQVPDSVDVRLGTLQKPRHAVDAGIRLQSFVNGWDMSLNYLYHTIDQPVYYVSQEEVGAVVPVYERTHLLGGTFSNAFGEFVLRGELGYSSDGYWVADLSEGGAGVVESPELAMVLGLDYSGITDTFSSFQLHLSRLEINDSDAVREDNELTWTALVRRQLYHQKVELELFAVQSVNRQDGLLQLQVKYSLDDHMDLYLNADEFYGDEAGLYGQYRDNDQLSFGVALSY